MGKSFEIRPTGVAHAELLIPEAWASDYPKASGSKNKGKVVEHYSWKKVTTNVSGFILGSPTIDHYGDMNVSSKYCFQTQLSHEVHRLSITVLEISVFSLSSPADGVAKMHSRSAEKSWTLMGA
jgi:hypothetical protein